MSKTFSFQDRVSGIQRLSGEEVFDLVIVGGGITGAGVARDAASRGMKVALVEARDFAEGTSSRSSKLIHGGIRYLENLEFGLVFEALAERSRLFQMAPHLVHPLRFLLPLYKGGRVGMFKMGLGMWLYDALALFETPQMHERLNPEATLRRLPVLRGQELLGSYVYSDAYMDDDRLVIETLRSAHRFEAVAVNYVAAVGAERDDRGRVTAVRCRDMKAGRDFRIRARHVISTVGPWTDELGSRLLGSWKKILRPSKGIHLTLHRSRLPLNQAVVMATDSDKRIVFAIPRHEMIIIGTTDTDFPDDPAEVKTTRTDVDYLLKIVGHYFPGAKITEADILASYSGVRPLVHDGSESESKTSREHVILRDERNVTFVAGGKYTTYRHMAEETVLTALETFSTEDRVRFQRSRSKEALNPLATPETRLKEDLLAPKWAADSGLKSDEVRFLIERHGLEAEALIARLPQLNGHRSRSSGRVWLLEALHAIDQTMCMDLKDFYLRRSPLFLAERDHGFFLLAALAETFAGRLGWSQVETENQVQGLKEHLRHEMGWQDPASRSL